jgi:hypothetical protein
MNLNQVLFERNTALPLGFTWLVCSALLVIGLLALAWIRRRPLNLQPTWLQSADGFLPTSRGMLKAAAVVAVITAVFGANNIIEWQKLRATLATQSSTTFEGVVTAASSKRITRSGNSQNPGWFDREVLQVADREFIAESNDPTTPFPLLVQNGGALDVGKSARFTFAGETIIKVESRKE